MTVNEPTADRDMNAISGLLLVSLIARFETAKELLLDSDLPASRIGGNMKTLCGTRIGRIRIPRSVLLARDEESASMRINPGWAWREGMISGNGENGFFTKMAGG